MVLQKAMKQGRNIHGIPILDACSDLNITSRMCGHVGGHAYSVPLSVQLKHHPPHCFQLSVELNVGLPNELYYIENNNTKNGMAIKPPGLACFAVQNCPNP